jgi:methyl-accepting chemotaxis protein
MRFIAAALLVTACSQQPAIVTDARKAELARDLQTQFTRSVDSEKAAVLASTDEESERFVNESRAASDRVNALRNELRELTTPPEREKLQAFDQAWAQVEAVDAKLLPLAEANTNLKAARLSTHEAAGALDEVLTALSETEANTKDPVKLRQLSAASVAALRIQALHAPHIAAPGEAEMNALETRVAELEKQVDPLVSTPAWTRYKELTQKIFDLSRQNTNVRSFEMSVHEKRDASKAAEAALQVLVKKLHDIPRASR